MNQPQPFQFHIISGAGSGPGCIVSNDNLEGMVDNHGQPVSIQHSFVAPRRIQQLLYSGLANTPLDVPLDQGGFNVPRRAIFELLSQTTEAGRELALRTLTESNLDSLAGTPVAEQGPEQPDTPYAHQINREIEELLDGPEQEKVWINLQLLTNALGTKFHEGWRQGKQELEQSN
jgi:hypothetical protein